MHGIPTICLLSLALFSNLVYLPSRLASPFLLASRNGEAKRVEDVDEKVEDES